MGIWHIFIELVIKFFTIDSIRLTSNYKVSSVDWALDSETSDHQVEVEVTFCSSVKTFDANIDNIDNFVLIVKTRAMHP